MALGWLSNLLDRVFILLSGFNSPDIRSGRGDILPQNDFQIEPLLNFTNYLNQRNENQVNYIDAQIQTAQNFSVNDTALGRQAYTWLKEAGSLESAVKKYARTDSGELNRYDRGNYNQLVHAYNEQLQRQSINKQIAFLSDTRDLIASRSF